MIETQSNQNDEQNKEQLFNPASFGIQRSLSKKQLTRLWITKLRKEVLPEFEHTLENLNILFKKPLLFDPDTLYIKRINRQELLMLLITIGSVGSAQTGKHGHTKVDISVFDLDSLSENECRLRFEKAKQVIKTRKWTYEELSNLFVAFGFPKPKKSKFTRDFHIEVQRLVRRIEKKMIT